MSADISLYSTDYDAAAVRTGFVHLGYGAFHRAHQAVFLDDYMHSTGDLSWGIAAVNLRHSDSNDFAKAGRNGYVLRTTAPCGHANMRLVRAHTAFYDWATSRSETETILAMPDVCAVTITVTESGYYLGKDWSLNVDDPVIAGEIAGGTPTSVYGFLATALEHRRRARGLPITILSCDNMRGNGRVLERAFQSYLHTTGKSALATWVRDNASFPCAMVDRITPRASEELTGFIDGQMPGYGADAIQAEEFSQWVIEDRFAGPMPDLSRVGVQIAPDIRPFEEAKIRILNGGHTGLAYFGALAGYSTFDEAMGDPMLRAHFDAWQINEVLPGLTVDLPFDKTGYLNQIAKRFLNVAISDRLDRICMDGYSKIPIYIAPTVRSCLEQGIEPEAGYRCIASWYVFARRSAAGTGSVPYHEPYWSELAPLLEPGQEHAFASADQIWGDLPERYASFVPGVQKALREVERQWPM